MPEPEGPTEPAGETATVVRQGDGWGVSNMDVDDGYEGFFRRNFFGAFVGFVITAMTAHLMMTR